MKIFLLANPHPIHSPNGSGPLPDLILLDLALPGMNGWEFSEQQRRDPRLAPIPVIVLTVFAQGSELFARSLGAVVLGKPVDLDRLRETIRQLCPPSAGHERPSAGLPFSAISCL